MRKPKNKQGRPSSIRGPEHKSRSWGRPRTVGVDTQAVPRPFTEQHLSYISCLREFSVWLTVTQWLQWHPVELWAQGWHPGPRVQILVCMQWGADACPVSLKLALSGILCFSASVPRSLHTKCDSTHFPTDVNILYKNTTFWRPLALALPLSIKSQGKWCPDRSNASWEVLLFSCLLCWSVSEWYLKFSPLDF